ncbi:hypothetical protein C8Q72DRAFT_531221 [Fomitopsis betulina]|nr:hypothetical protein C8Q72DRAFT_531221 [Fomitopsis betulina]
MLPAQKDGRLDCLPLLLPTTMARREQFQHYVPRFVIRGWLQEVKTVANPRRKSKARRRKGRPPREYKEELINTYNIDSKSLHMRTTDLGKTFGVVDLYKDDTDPTDVDHIEKAFSKLESSAARVFQVLDDAEKRGRSSVQLDHSQLNCLRKFLFLLHYRNGTHASQFIEGVFDPLTESMVEDYRIKYNLPDARAVWLRNLALLLEDEHWKAPTDERLTWTTRMDYKYAIDMQLALYRAPSGTEFVLTENGLGLEEGADSAMLFLGGHHSGYLTLTQSFPITPKLVIFLRSTLLTREAVMIQSGVSPAEAQRLTYGALGLGNASYFHDFPTTLAKTTYIPALPEDMSSWRFKMTPESQKKIDDFQQRSLLNGEPLHARLRDQFVFAIDNLTQDQAERVNVLRLTHCKETISFMTPAALLNSITAFERDCKLSRDNKNRYASLKAKLIAEQASSAPAPSPIPIPLSPPATPDTTPPSISAIQPATYVNAAPLETSLPGQRGALKGKAARAVLASDTLAPSTPNLVVLATHTTQTIAASSKEHISTGKMKAELPSQSSVSLPGREVASSAVQGYPERSTSSASGSLSGLGTPHLSSAITSHTLSATLASREKSARVEVALPGLRGAFNRKPAAWKSADVHAVLVHQSADVLPSAASIAPVDDATRTVFVPVEVETIESVAPPGVTVEPIVHMLEDSDMSTEQLSTVVELNTPFETSIDLQADVEVEAGVQEVKPSGDIEEGGVDVEAEDEEGGVDVEAEGEDGLRPQSEERPAWLDIPVPSWLIPCLGVVAVAVLVFGGRFLGTGSHRNGRR